MTLDFRWHGPFDFSFEPSDGSILTAPDMGNRWGAERIIYMLEFMPPYFVRYKNSKSAICYIGQASNSLRLASHRGTWFQKVAVVLEGFQGFRMRACQPRVRNNLDAYKKVEGDAISTFYEIYEERPIFNQKGGKNWSEHSYSDDVIQSTRKLFELPMKGYSREICSVGAKR